jgi:ABC-type uncharacterized transport system ATPase subunit
MDISFILLGKVEVVMENILEIRNVYKYFGSFCANKDISLTVKKGSVHSIIGENGAGKSTLMNMISGIYQPSMGEIFVKGQSVNFKNPNDAAKYGIGMVHQEFMLFPELTVLENLMMGYETKKLGIFLDKKVARKEIEEICKKYHFSLPLDEHVEDLPVSVLQQVEIVKVLYKGADIIILDEPTAVLTPQGIQGLFDAIRALTDKQKTIILITHKLNEVMEISDYITVLKNGKVTGNLTPSEADEKKLASLMVGREVLFNTQKKEKEIGDVILSVENLVVNNDEDISKVKGVSFSVRSGEIVGVAGVAGSGQTELVEALFGLRRPSEGKVSYKGEDFTYASPRERRCKKIGYVPQDRLSIGCSVNSNLIENSIMGYHVAHGFKNSFIIDKKEAKDFTQNIVDGFKVKAGSLNNAVRSLSGGNIQKLIVGREFIQDNDLLIIEDPTRGIDVGSIEFIWQEIIKISEKGVGVLLISHELNEVIELSDRILVMYDGKITTNRPAKELDEQTIGLYMLGGASDE